MMHGKEQTFDCIIIGAGPSGLAAAITYAREVKQQKAPVSILVVEKEKKVARKLLASGNGRCNLGNRHVQVSDYETNQPDFLERILKASPPHFIDDFFMSCGIAIKEDEAGRLYPVSEEASAVHALLVQQADSLGVQIKNDCEIKRIRQLNSGWELLDRWGHVLTSRSLLLAVGSQAAPSLGGSKSAEVFAHDLALPYQDETPALTALLLDDELFNRTAAGARFKGEALLSSGRTFYGEFLISKLGLSGIVAMDISNYLGNVEGKFEHLKEEVIYRFGQVQSIHIDFVPAKERRDLAEWLIHTFTTLGIKDPTLLAASLVQKKVLQAILQKRKKELNIKDFQTYTDQAFIKELRHWAYWLKHFEFEITGLRSFQYAQVSRGGILCSQLRDDFSVCEVNNLYASGECLDVVGRCGGFNLFFAFLSGYLAGKAISEQRFQAT